MSEWVSVDDRLPEIKDDGVLVYWSSTGGMGTVHIRDYFSDIESELSESGKQIYTKWYISSGITHWMPLPEPPKAYSNE